jgi:outer membrane immunogenic protein
MSGIRLAVGTMISAATGLALLSTQAFGADLGSMKDAAPPDAPALNWQGFYLGGHAGGVWTEPKVTDKFTYIGDPTVEATLGSRNFIGGAQAGYNIQRGRFVFGPEADIGYLGISTDRSFFQPGTNDACQVTYPGDQYPTYYGGWACNISGRYSVSGGLYGDLTARLGYDTGRTLFYAKGGGALLNADFKSNYVGNNCTVAGPYCEHVGGGGTYDTVSAHTVFNYNHNDTLLGWTVGAGAEYALTAAWSLKAEYQHFDFGKMSYTYYGCYGFPLASGSYPDPTYGVCPPGSPAWDHHYTSTLRGKADISITADSVTVGLNYHLDSGGGALK